MDPGRRALPVLPLSLALVLVLALRGPGHFLDAQLFAEDGTVYFKQAYDAGFWGSVLAPAAGYLSLYPRLAAALAQLAPLSAVPLVLALAALLAHAAPIPYLLSTRMSRHIPSAPLRLVAALIYVAAPNSLETYGNVTNAQWHLGLLLVCLLLAGPPRTRLETGADAACLVLAALTGPFAALLLPWALLRAFEERHTPGKRWSLVLLALLGAAALVQTGFLLGSPRNEVQAGPLSAGEGLTIVSTHAFWNTILGIVGTWRHGGGDGFGPAWNVAGLAALGLLALYAALRRNRALLVLLSLAAATVTLSFISPLNPLRDWLRSEYAPRYYLFAALFVCYSLLLLCCEKGRARWAGLPVAAVCLVMGFRLDFPLLPIENTLWRDQAAVFMSLPAGSRYYFPIRPEEWGISLEKRTALQAPSPLAGLRREEGEPRLALDPVRIRWKPGESGVDTWVAVAGWALDTATGLPAGKVYLLVDDGVYPAVMRLHRRDLKSRDGFARLIPCEDLGPGRHVLAVAVLSADGRSYRVSGQRSFVVEPWAAGAATRAPRS